MTQRVSPSNDLWFHALETTDRVTIVECLQAVGLQEQQDVRADELSGGMKRRLQVALALLGSSRVILLGMSRLVREALRPHFLLPNECCLQAMYSMAGNAA